MYVEGWLWISGICSVNKCEIYISRYASIRFVVRSHCLCPAMGFPLVILYTYILYCCECLIPPHKVYVYNILSFHSSSIF